MLRLLAWGNVVVHIAGLALAVFGMRPGTPLVPLPERRAYLADVPVGWALGWGVWMLCALALVAFVAALAHRLRESPPTGGLAVTLAAAGAAVDLLCDTIHIAVTPALARAQEALFLAFERTATAAGLIVANGLYSAATLLLTVGLARRGASGATVATGYGVFVCGMVMVAAGLLDSPRLAELSTGPTILLFCTWSLLAAYTLEPTRAHS